jgi:hypothetical protein
MVIHATQVNHRGGGGFKISQMNPSSKMQSLHVMGKLTHICKDVKHSYKTSQVSVAHVFG